MTTFLVLTIIADDKPGLVGKLSQVIADNGGNWMESSMSQLAGKFAGILRVNVPDAEADKLIAELNKLGGTLKLVIEKVAYHPSDVAARTLKLHVVGNDRPGIIRDVSQILSRHSVNVEDLETECAPAPMSGDMLFKASALLRITNATDIDVLQSELEDLADDLIVDVKSP
jgi:glycine cleavage system regulatory protein